MDNITAAVDKLVAAETADTAQAMATAQHAYTSSRMLSLILLVGGLLVAAFASTVRSLAQVQQVCDGLADPDLTKSSELTSRDEPGRMGRVDAAVVRLRATVSTIDGSATSLASASEEISAAARQIAGSAQETSAQAQTVAAAAEEVSASVGTVSGRRRGDGRINPRNLPNAAQVAHNRLRPRFGSCP